MLPAMPSSSGTRNQKRRRQTARARSLTVRFFIRRSPKALRGLRGLPRAVDPERQAQEIAGIIEIAERRHPGALPDPGVAALDAQRLAQGPRRARRAGGELRQLVPPVVVQPVGPGPEGALPRGAAVEAELQPPAHGDRDTREGVVRLDRAADSRPRRDVMGEAEGPADELALLGELQTAAPPLPAVPREHRLGDG